MKIKCNRIALHEAFQIAASIVPARTPKDILKCAKLTADADTQTVSIIATDNDIIINYQVNQVQVENEGSLVVPADRMAAILHESRDETIDMELQESTCKVAGKDSHFNIYGFDPDDFPVAQVDEPKEALEVQAQVLNRMISMTSFAAAKENSRYAINGVLFEQTKKKIRMVATDGRRLAQIDGSLIAAPTIDEQTAIIPVKALGIIGRLLGNPDEKIKVQIDKNQIIVATTKARISANLVQGRFPRYSDVIPSNCDKIAKIPLEELQSCVRQVALLANEQTKGIQLDFTKNNLHLYSSAPEAGDADIKMSIDYDNEDIKIGFNPQYMLEVLRAVDQPEVTFELLNGSKPGVLRVGKDYLYVLMPVTV